MSTPVSIPRFPDEVTSTWLTGVLTPKGQEIRVSDVIVDPIGTGQTGATYRISATYSANPAGLPTTFVIKLPVEDDESRARVALGYRSECAFYASVAEQVQIPVPRSFHCEITEDSLNYALLLADQAPKEQGDQIAGCSEREAKLAGTAIAGLHGPTWNAPEWLTFDGLAMISPDAAGAKGLGDVCVMSAGLTAEKLAARLSSADVETLTAAMSLVTPWLLADFGRFSLLHGDYRLDNILFHPDNDEISVVDWQTLSVGLPARDLAYFMGTSVRTELRRSIERNVVDTYHAALSGYEIDGFDLESCWHDYRFGMIQALLMPSLGCAFAVDSSRGDDMFVSMIERGCQAIRDLDTLKLVAEESVTGRTPGSAQNS